MKKYRIVWRYFILLILGMIVLAFFAFMLIKLIILGFEIGAFSI